MSLRRALPAVACAALLLAFVAPAFAADGDGEVVSDPWQGMNRKIFGFNEGVDRWVLEPVATGWDFVMPDPVERSISNFFHNLSFPVILVNNLLQGKVEGTIVHFGRTLVNTTIGVAGFFDPAGEWLRIPDSDEDFGQTLGVWGVPTGPYLVLPLLGPSNPRDTGGLVVDAGLNGYSWWIPWYATAGLTTVRIVNQRARLLETIREERKDAFDFYVAVRNAYAQRREAQVADRRSEESDDDLYDVDLLDETE